MHDDTSSGIPQSPSPSSPPPFTAPKPGTGPSPAAILAVLGGCLFAAVLMIGIAVLGVFYFVQLQKARQAEQVARDEASRAAQQAVYRQNIAREQAQRQAENSQRAIMEAAQVEQMRLKAEEERKARVASNVEAARQARLKMEQEKFAEQSRQGIHLVQAALFRNIDVNDPECLLAPGPQNGSGLSWRVHLLPSLGFNALHQEFHLDEAWDSEHNQSLISKMPSIYGLDPQSGLTRIRSFLRLDGDGGTRTRVGEILDGLEQTALLFHVGEKQAILWTQPDNIQQFTPVTPDRIGISDGEEIRYTLCGNPTVWSVKLMPPEVLQALCTPAGGEHLDDDLIAGRLTDPAVSLRIASLVEATEFASVEPLSKEQESREAHQKLKLISEAFMRREVQLTSNPDTQSATRSPLSWRVHLLPFLGEEELFRKFDLSQPWNSEANLPLASKMPDVFKLGSFGGRTRFILSLPKDCRRTGGQLPAAGAITDAAELTSLVYLAAPQCGVTWTKPDSTDAMKGTLQQTLGWPPTHSVIAATFGGSTVEIPANLHPSKLAALISTHRGETFDLPLALENPEQQLRLAPRIRPAEPVADLITLPKLPVDTGAFKPATSVPDAARFRSLNHAVFKFYDSLRQSPTNVQSPNGVRSQLSWRVHLLPFLDQKPLYDRFKLDEPWDSEHNLALLEFMPEAFRCTPEAVSTTRLRVISGKGSLFAADKKWMQAPDGILNMIMIVETGAPFEQEWTRPDTELELSSLDFQELFGDATEIRALIGNGEVLRFVPQTPGAVFRALATANGGELIDASTVQRWLAHQRGEALMAPQLETRWESQQMSSIALAAMNYHDVYHYFPPQQKNDPRDPISLRSSQLSWRVHLLPYLGQSAVFKQFRLEEPWDSPHNTQLLSLMPDCYRDADNPADSHTTRIVRVMGQGTPFAEIGLAPTMRDIKDGTSQTLHFMQAPSEDAVPWTRPDDLLVNLEDPRSLELLQRLASTPALKTATFDGAVRQLAPNVSGETLKGFITPSGGELLNTRELFLPN